MEINERHLKNIPWQSLGVLLMHQAGIDLKEIMANNTFYAHKRVLESHGFDITPPRKKRKPYRRYKV